MTGPRRLTAAESRRRQAPSVYLTLTQAAAVLSVDRRTIQNWCRAGKVPGAFRTPGGHWRVTQSWATKDYIMMKDDDGRVRGEHCIVMERHLGRSLAPGEVVHHKDGDKRNNAIDNLEIMWKGPHGGLHSKMHAADCRARGVSPIRPRDDQYSLTAAEAARRIGVNKSTMTRWISAGKVPAVRQGGRWRVRATWVDAELARIAKP